MNDKFTNTPNSDDETVAHKLSQIAEQTHANSQFAAQLEERLRSAHRPTRGWFSSLFTQVSPTLRWVALMVLLAVVLSWSIRSLIPSPQPSGDGTPNGFLCPVTQPNDSLPPGTQSSETTDDPDLLGNGQLWTVLQPGGKAYVFPENQRTDGSFEVNWPWYRGLEGQLRIEGHRLDAQAEPLLYELPEGFNNFQGSTLIFPTTGCWEITGRVGEASLTFVTEVILDAGLPTPTVQTMPDIVMNGTPTAEVNEGGYDFRGAKLYLEQPLPESPTQAYVYLSERDESATQEDVRALAERFGIQGEMYTAPGLVYGTTDYVVSDGKQFLQAHSDNYFMYTADMAKNKRAFPAPANPNAEAIIREFLHAHGYDFPFRVSASELSGGYEVQPLAPDSIPMQFESFSAPIMRVVLEENGQVLTINATLLKYDSNPLGEYGIISAQEAFGKLLDDNNPGGKMEFFHSPSKTPQQWYREYPNDQVVTMYGYVTSNPSSEPNGSPLVLIDGLPVVGNIEGLENLENYTFVQATGQFSIEDGIRKFHVESWDRNVELSFLTGTLHREGDQVLFVADDGGGSRYPLVDPPGDLPVDVNTAVADSQVTISGVVVNGELFWTYIQYLEGTSGGGGGGGGGAGFYQLNLTGTPVPFPTQQSNSGVQVITYVVQENDTVASIAEQFGIAVEELSLANNLGPENIISAGQTLTIFKPQSIPEPGRGEHTIREGDTLHGIAEIYGITVDELMQANGMTPESIIIVGETLVIPGAQSNPLIGKRFEDQRGIFIVNVYRKPDGSQRIEYAFTTTNANETYYLRLEGESLEELERYHNRPVDIWATIESADQFGGLTARVDRFEVPFPDLPIQVFKGTQKVVEMEGQSVLTLIAENGTTYVQMGPAGDVLNEGSMFGSESEPIFVEALIIPDENFAGYPTMRIYGMNYVVDPISGQTNEMNVTADQPYIMEEELRMENYVPPSLTINKVELVYYTSNPYYQVNNPNYDQRSPHIQPVWHFEGRYEDGTEFDVLIQALKQEFLLPELAPAASPG